MDTDYRAIGKHLQDARENHGLTLEDVSSSTKIQMRYLQAIETGQVDKLPGPFYVKAFIRQYANTVGLDPNTILDTSTKSNESAGSDFKSEQENSSNPDSLFFGEEDSKNTWNNDQTEKQQPSNEKLSKNSIRVGPDRIPRAGMNLSVPMSQRLIKKIPLFVAIVVLFLLAFGAWIVIGKVHTDSATQTKIDSSSTQIQSSKQSSSKKSSSSSSSSSSGSSDVEALSKPQFNSSTATMTFYDNKAHTIQVQASSASWTIFTVDSVTQFETTIPAGSYKDVTLSKDQKEATIHVGNPYNTKILFDSKNTNFMSGSSVQITNIIIKREKVSQ
ncbi:helix-turn-helix domain-containing protein [Oenococcus sp. UCMA 16435]|nr:helix-turn-helix domain-containing protein [Oenococcus sp. UCMA 16435]MDI4583492.1 helix-turn-helix domain-containing protein [Oenococcus sp. UCMA 14587]